MDPCLTVLSDRSLKIFYGLCLRLVKLLSGSIARCALRQQGVLVKQSCKQRDMIEKAIITTIDRLIETFERRIGNM